MYVSSRHTRYTEFKWCQQHCAGAERHFTFVSSLLRKFKLKWREKTSKQGLMGGIEMKLVTLLHAQVAYDIRGTWWHKHSGLGLNFLSWSVKPHRGIWSSCKPCLLLFTLRLKLMFQGAILPTWRSPQQSVGCVSVHYWNTANILVLLNHYFL